MKEQIEQLRADNVRIHTEIVELNDLAKTEDRDLSAEEQETFDSLSEAFDKNKAARDRLERIEEIAAVQDEPIREAVSSNQVGEPEQEPAPDGVKGAAYRTAFSEYLTTDWVDMDPASRATLRAQSVGTTTAGGFAVPDEAMAALENSLLAFGGVRRAPITVLRTADGRPLPIPTTNDTANVGVILAENTGASDQDVTFGQIILNAYKFSSDIIKVSQEFIDDASIDVASWAVEALGVRIARGLAPYLVDGDGIAEPGGLDLAASFVTAAAAGAITRTDILDLIHSVDPAYRTSPAFGLIFNDATLKAIKLLAVSSTDDRPLWQVSMRDGAPDTVEGLPFTVVTDVGDVAAGERSVFAGDFSKFLLREAGPIRVKRLLERYGELDQVGFVAFARYDSDILDAGTDPIKYLRHPAS